MGEYRAYILDEDGHISVAIPFLCPDEEAAKKYARQLVDGHDVELWGGDREIAPLAGGLEWGRLVGFCVVGPSCRPGWNPPSRGPSSVRRSRVTDGEMPTCHGS